MADKDETLPEPVSIGWMTLGTIDGKKKLESPHFATNPEYVKAYKEWKWETVHTASTLREAIKGARLKALEEAATLVQNYYTNGDHTQGWQDTFAQRIRKLTEDEQ